MFSHNAQMYPFYQTKLQKFFMGIDNENCQDLPTGRRQKLINIKFVDKMYHGSLQPVCPLTSKVKWTVTFFFTVQWCAVQSTSFQYSTVQYIILKLGILRFNSVNITSKQGVYFTVHSLGSIQTNFK